MSTGEPETRAPSQAAGGGGPTDNGRRLLRRDPKTNVLFRVPSATRKSKVETVRHATNAGSAKVRVRKTDARPKWGPDQATGLKTLETRVVSGQKRVEELKAYFNSVQAGSESEEAMTAAGNAAKAALALEKQLQDLLGNFSDIDTESYSTLQVLLKKVGSMAKYASRAQGRANMRGMPAKGKMQTPSGPVTVDPNDETLARYGETYRTATPAQKINRRAHGYTGYGEYETDMDTDADDMDTPYSGRGGYVGRWVGEKLGNTGFGRALGLNASNVSDFEDGILDSIVESGAASKIPRFGIVAQPALAGAVEGYKKWHAEESTDTPLPYRGRESTDMPLPYRGRGEYESVKRNRAEASTDVLKWGTMGPAAPRSTAEQQAAMFVSALNELDGNRNWSAPRGYYEGGDLVVVMRELVKGIRTGLVATTGFQTVANVQLNPGLKASFPMGSELGKMFSKYDMEQCVFEYVSLASSGYDNIGGSVSIGVHSDPNSADWTEKSQMSAGHTFRLTDNKTIGVECDNRREHGAGKYYMRRVAVTRNLASYDMGRLQVAVEGVPTPDQLLGDLYVYYKVRFMGMQRQSEADSIEIGEGISFSLRSMSGYQQQHLMSEWLGVGAYYTGSVAMRRFPFPQWSRASNGEIIGIGDGAIVGTTNVEAPHHGSYQIASFSQAPGMSMLIHPHTGSGFNKVTFHFLAQMGTTYAFMVTYTIHAVGDIALPTSRPLIAGGSNSPDALVDLYGTMALGKMNVEIAHVGGTDSEHRGATFADGGIKMRPVSFAQRNVTHWDGVTVNEGDMTSVKILTCFVPIRANTDRSANCSLTVYPDIPTFSADAQFRVQSMDWSLVRMS